MNISSDIHFELILDIFLQNSSGVGVKSIFKKLCELQFAQHTNPYS